MRFRLVVAACGHLRESAELFRSLSAQPWADRAENELRATGKTVRKRDPSTLDQLTPQELQIAGLVASGLTNREIASQLFLSPRTVEYHLRKVFAKLGLASRIELIRRRPWPGLSRRPTADDASHGDSAVHAEQQRSEWVRASPELVLLELATGIDSEFAEGFA
jgi:DNA-binding CsgD family transcriptional regulator